MIIRYEHFYFTDSLLGVCFNQRNQNSHNLFLYNTTTSIIWTPSSSPLVSAWKRFDLYLIFLTLRKMRNSYLRSNLQLKPQVWPQLLGSNGVLNLLPSLTNVWLFSLEQLSLAVLWWCCALFGSISRMYLVFPGGRKLFDLYKSPNC